MKVIIPAKKNSSRVPDKNWRPFHQNKNLVEIKIEQLLKTTNGENIFLSCDDLSKKAIADKYGIGFLLREPKLASDDTPWPDALQGIIGATDFAMEEEIAWVEVINPLFSDYSGLFKAWQEQKHKHDSVVLTSPVNKFLLNSNGKPLNFQFGKWHAMSQNMEALHAWDSACIMRKKDLLYFSYPIGKTPFLYSTNMPCIDIDTPEDFELAQYFFNKQSDNEKK